MKLFSVSFLLYTIYHWYLILIYFFNELPNHHIIKRLTPLIHYIQGTTSVFETPPAGNIYGPVFNLIMHPFMVLSDFFHLGSYNLSAFYLTTLCILAMLFVILFYYARTYSLSGKIIIVCLVLNFQPLVYDLQTTYPELWETALILVALVLYKRGRHSLSGFCLATASLIKLYPALLVFLFLFIKRRVFLWSLFYMGVLILLAQIIYGDAMGIGYLTGLMNRSLPSSGDSLVSYGILTWDAISLRSVILKILVGFRSTPGGTLILSNPDLVGKALSLYAAIVLITFVGFTLFYLKIRRSLLQRNKGKLHEDFLISIGCLFILLLGPHGGFQYMVLSLPAFLLSLDYLPKWQSKPRSITPFLLLGSYLLFTGIIMPNTLFLKLTHFNEIALFLLPQLATRSSYEIYHFVGFPMIGLLFLLAFWLRLSWSKSLS